MTDTPTVAGGMPRGLDALILPPQLKPAILLEWMEYSRHFLYAAGVLLGADAAAIDAKLRKPGRVPIVGGMLDNQRARAVSKPVADAGGACLVACQYLQQAANKFESVYIPELEAIGYQPKPNDFWRP